MLAEMLQRIEGLVKQGVDPKVLHSDEWRDRVFLPSTSGTIDVQKQWETHRDHVFYSVAELIDYLNSRHTEADQGVVFIGKRKVTAVLRYGKLPHQGEAPKAVLPLAHTQEFEAVQSLSEGIPHKDVWRILATTLRGCVGEELLLAVAQVQVKKKSDQQYTVSSFNSGVEGQKTIEVQFPNSNGGTNQARFETDWVFTIPVYECLEADYSIQTRLEIDAEGNLIFFFHLIRLHDVMRQVRLDLIEEIRGGLTNDRFTVHEGEFLARDAEGQ